MKTAAKFGLALLILLPNICLAQQDTFGKLDTMYADVARVDSSTWSITVSYDNDQDVEGLTVALKMTAGMTKIVADSAIYTGGRVEHFSYKGFRPDSAIQCVTLGMVANLGPIDKYLAAGTGRLCTIFVSSLGNQAVEKLMIDTTTTQPANTLMAIAYPYQHQGDKIDTIPIDRRRELEILPAWVVKYVE